jgi:carboxylesterase type B
MIYQHVLSLSLWVAATMAAPAIERRQSSLAVKVKNGTLEGVHSDEWDQDYFLGIPYAQPPVGSLRFRVPQSINTSWNETLQAKEYSATCVGYGSDNWPYPNFGEDCLYLNVVRPSGYEGEKLPVAFWIHGGGLTMGSGSDDRYNFSQMIQNSVNMGKPIMGVSINYRLSMWGFVTGDEALESGNTNIGFRDQRLALHWVQENIEAFGGMLRFPYLFPQIDR